MGRDRDHQARFARARLEKLEPSPESFLSADRQREIITDLQAHPTDSYLLIGPPGTGKTHLSIALYRKAVTDFVNDAYHRRFAGTRCIWRVSAPVLVDKLYEFASTKHGDDQSPIKMPPVTVDAIQMAAKEGLVPRLWIDELDKIDPFAPKIAKLGAIVDAVYAANGQIVATMNATEDKLVVQWKGDADAAMSVIRRIGIGENAHTINF